MQKPYTFKAYRDSDGRWKVYVVHQLNVAARFCYIAWDMTEKEASELAGKLNEVIGGEPYTGYTSWLSGFRRTIARWMPIKFKKIGVDAS